MPPCSAASRCSAALRPCGRLRRPGPGLRAAVVWPLSSAAGPRPVKRQAWRRGRRDSARCTRRRSPARRGRARRRARSAASPCVCSSACSRSTSCIQICGRRCVSSVRYAEARRARDRADAAAADSGARVCPRPRRPAGRDAPGRIEPSPGCELPHMLGTEAAGDDPHASRDRDTTCRASRSRRAASSTDALSWITTPIGLTLTGIRSARSAGAIRSGRNRARSSAIRAGRRDARGA